MTRLRLLPVLVIISVSLGAISATGQRTTRKNLKPSPSAVISQDRAVNFDTIATTADSGAIDFTGYEKTLTSTKESFFATNHTDSLITRLDIELIYFDMAGRQLDTRQLTLDTEMMPGQTRRFDIRSWDRQKVFYYYLSPVPRSKTATPYKVAVRLVTALRKHE